MRRTAAAIFFVSALALTGAMMARHGTYGWTLFVILPFAVGFFGAWFTHAETLRGAMGAGGVATIIGSFALLAMAQEGFACVMMSWPLIVPVGAIGGLIYGLCTRSDARPQVVSMLLLLPIGTTTFDLRAKPDVFQVHSQIEIAAPAAEVWKHVVTFSEITGAREWHFRTGLAYPMRARIDGRGPGATRYCEFSTGPFVEPIEVWDEPRLLQFTVTKNPPPMHEWSPYGDVHPKHLDGYMISKRGQFKLTPIDDRHTLLEGNTWYQHGLWPSQYWRWWSEAIIHRIHMRVLRHIKMETEAAATE